MSIPTPTGVSVDVLTHLESFASQRIGRDALIVGLSGVRQNAAVACVFGGNLQAFCEQERVTRIRSVGLSPAVLPQEAIDAALTSSGRERSEISAFVTGESEAVLPANLSHVRLDHHFAHAATAVLTSPHGDATVLVCDQHSSPPISVWSYTGERLTNYSWPCSSGFASLYSECAEVFGFGARSEHRLEAIARLGVPGDRELDDGVFSYRDGCLHVDPAWKTWIADELTACGGTRNVRVSAAIAGSFQRRLGDVLVELLQDISRALPHDHLCVGGGLFYNTYFNTRMVTSGLFRDVFVPLNPGNPGLAAGAALAVASRDRGVRQAPSPFLGPEYTLEDIKSTLDNCKLTYDFRRDTEIIDEVVDALSRGERVAWFQGRMEWGHRALGNRSILANPFAPHVLENLNVFLKKRDAYRAYGLSVCEEDATYHFSAPGPSPFMELEFAPLDRNRFSRILPDGATTLRVQTVPAEPRRFRDLHRAFAAATGVGVLVNTSFNGFHEPIVCSPRDAIRVFFGTGLDMLVLDRFVVRK